MRALLVVVAIVAGCKKAPAGEVSCAQAGAKFYELAQRAVAASTAIDDRERTGVTGLLAPMRDSMVRACLDDGWSATARACFAGALDQAQYKSCETTLSSDQRARLARGAER